MTKIYFKDTNKTINLSDAKFVGNTPLPKNKIKLNLTSVLSDTKSINILESNIIDCIKYHNDFLSLLNLPPQIDIKFTNTNKINQIYNNIINNETTANTENHLHKDNNLINPLINISTDILKNKQTINGDIFLNNCKHNLGGYKRRNDQNNNRIIFYS